MNNGFHSILKITRIKDYKEVARMHFECRISRPVVVSQLLHQTALDR
jgi:hypothetical protein